MPMVNILLDLKNSGRTDLISNEELVIKWNASWINKHI